MYLFQVTKILILSLFTFSIAQSEILLPRWNMSLHQQGTLSKRQTGYNPIAGYCGTGNSCSESCGKNFETCQSNEATLHCFNPVRGQICCPNGSGFACDPGFYCTQDVTGKTFCCPDGMDLITCAGVYSVVSLETAHSITTSSTTITAIAASTITAVSTLIITINDDIPTTSTVRSTTTSSVFGNGNAGPTVGVNTTYFPFIGKGGKEIGGGWRWGVVLGIGWGVIRWLDGLGWF